MENLNLLSRVRRASDAELFDGVESLTLTEHSYLVKVIVLLGEIDRRGIYREKAWPSSALERRIDRKRRNVR
jgi:hypothetical protein